MATKMNVGQSRKIDNYEGAFSMGYFNPFQVFDKVSVILTKKQNDSVKDKNVCLMTVQGNQIVASVKVKIANVEYFPRPTNPLPSPRK